MTPKHKHRVVGAVVLIGVFVLAAIGSSMLSKKDHKPIVKSKPKVSLLKDKIDKDQWIAAEGSNIRALEKANEDLKSQLGTLKEGVDSLNKKLEQDRKGAVGAPDENKESKSTLKAPLPQFAKKTETFPPKDKPMMPPPSGKKDILKDGPRGNQGQAGQPTSTIRVFSDEGRDGKKKEGELKDKNKGQVFLPAGSFMKSVLLNGINAPTNGSAQGEPYPVLMSVSDLSMLPNRHRVDLVECFIVGAGYGNLSDERAYIRTETLSCVRKDGKVLDIALKGHVIGEDGKLGMRGRIVSKQGQQIAYSLLAGTMSAVGNAFRPSSNISVNITDQARTNPSLNFGDSLMGVGQSGVGLAFNKVADFYLKMADKIYPVIEIDAGRNVEVIMLRGQNLKIVSK